MSPSRTGPEPAGDKPAPAAKPAASKADVTPTTSSVFVPLKATAPPFEPDPVPATSRAASSSAPASDAGPAASPPRAPAPAEPAPIAGRSAAV